MIQGLFQKAISSLGLASKEKAQTTQLKFGVHNHYNNNSDRIGDFESPMRSCIISEVPVRLTDAGIVVFNLRKNLSLKQKVTLAIALDDLLKQRFGIGLSFATCGSSDCVSERELQPYYDSMKHINPNMITIFTSSKFFSEDKWIGCPEDLKVDHIVDQWARNPNTAAIITRIVNPNGTGKDVPPEGWWDFERSLDDLYDTAHAQMRALLQQRDSQVATETPVPARRP